MKKPPPSARGDGPPSSRSMPSAFRDGWPAGRSEPPPPPPPPLPRRAPCICASGVETGKPPICAPAGADRPGGLGEEPAAGSPVVDLRFIRLCALPLRCSGRLSGVSAPYSERSF